MTGETEQLSGKIARTDILATLFSSRVRAEILRLLFIDDEVELHLREIQRRSGLALGTVQQDLVILRTQDLVVSHRDGNRVLFLANGDHPLFAPIREIVLRTVGIVSLLSQVFRGELIRCALANRIGLRLDALSKKRRSHRSASSLPAAGLG